jgi:hypothetical protein
MNEASAFAPLEEDMRRLFDEWSGLLAIGPARAPI